MISPDSLEQLYAFGVSQQRAGRAESAVATYRCCLLLSPASAEIHNDLGTALDQLGRLPEAVRCFEQALARHRLAQFHRDGTAPETFLAQPARTGLP